MLNILFYYYIYYHHSSSTTSTDYNRIFRASYELPDGTVRQASGRHADDSPTVSAQLNNQATTHAINVAQSLFDESPLIPGTLNTITSDNDNNTTEPRVEKDPANDCLDVAIITDPKLRTKKTIKKLKNIAGRVLNKKK